MDEQKLHFRVGLFVVIAIVTTGAMVFRFGEIKSILEDKYLIAVHFETAPGIYTSSPVKMNGVAIGAVRDVVFDQKRGGITVLIDIKKQYQLRTDSTATLKQTLLGDASIEFTPGTNESLIEPGTILEGTPPVDPMEIIGDLNNKLAMTMKSFDDTSREWQQVAKNLNGLMDTNRGNLNLVVERAAESLQQFTQTMKVTNNAVKSANKLVADPKVQESLRTALTSLPTMMRDTQQVIVAVRETLASTSANLENLKEATSPLAKHSTSIIVRLDKSLANFESLSSELDKIAKAANRSDGSFNRFATDPHLYQNLNRSAESLSVLLNNLEPVVRDMRIFSDKIARHPEILGVRGALKSSSGIKEVPETARGQSPGRRLRN